jgi:starch-binding outer membrane protein, SusD/RagB family
MKLIFKLLFAVCLITYTMTSCDKMLDVDSDRFLKTDDYKLNSSGQITYAMSGIFEQLQKVAERYVLLGELRGDLMDLTPEAGLYLKQINNFEITADNPYANIKDYYAIINNCNYLIERIDTSVIYQGQKILYTVYAATKAIRAWTYMQIALNYGKAAYYEKPILSIDDANKDYPQYSITELANVLIPDLLPWKDISYPNLGTIGQLNSSKFYFPIRFLLGELYLWSGQYELAAIAYHDLIDKGQLHSNSIQIKYNIVGGEVVSWSSTTYSDEVVSVIGTTSEKGEGSHLKEWSWPSIATDTTRAGKYILKPSAQSIYNWDNQVYYTTDVQLPKVEGDLRGKAISYQEENFTLLGTSVKGYDKYIYKFYRNDIGYSHSEVIPTCKTGLVYLRYAEAVNRLGKPNLAFAVLKNGLNKVTMADRTIFPASEIPNPKPNYMNFDTIWFNANIGMHARGCGYTALASDYIIPALPSKNDSIIYVEDQIKLELALENAFEGNRFHDLMRLAIRRNDPSYLANTVAEKYTGNKEAIRSKLINMDNWYLPEK